MDPATFTHSSS